MTTCFVSFSVCVCVCGACTCVCVSSCSLPDVWVNETERSELNTKVVHLSQLPQDSAMLLDPNIYRALPQKQLKRR
uniref:AEBP2-like C-terminal SH3 domain-containing protein n=1 Tax=Hucho hucho TaxID=62062 RepID=A0A4W5JLP7_9TELE